MPNSEGPDADHAVELSVCRGETGGHSVGVVQHGDGGFDSVVAQLGCYQLLDARALELRQVRGLLHDSILDQAGERHAHRRQVLCAIGCENYLFADGFDDGFGVHLHERIIVVVVLGKPPQLRPPACGRPPARLRFAPIT